MVPPHRGTGAVVLGAYGSLIEAGTETEQADHEFGTFLVQSVGPGPDAYTHTNHSRVLRTFGLPNGVVVQNVPVSQSEFAGGDVLVGMDIINTGDFAITHPNGQTKFTFRIPPQADIDFVDDA